MPLAPDRLDRLPRHGWVGEASPVQVLPELASQLGLGALWVKRDDMLDALGGGNKVRTLDYLLASEPYATAPQWQSVGGIGSGQLVTMAQAASRLGRRLQAHCFFQPLTADAEANLALIASGPTTFRFYGSRLALGVLRPRLFVGPQWKKRPVVPPGGSAPAGMVGYVRAGLELGEQIRSGILPEPDHVYVAFGSGGTAVGLSVGLGLARVRTQVRAIVAVEWVLSSWLRVRGLMERLRTWLVEHGVGEVGAAQPAPLALDRSQLGPGYGWPTAQSDDACAKSKGFDLHLEPVYTGKTFAALLRDAPSLAGKSVLYWNTVRGQALAPNPAWRELLPPAVWAGVERSNKMSARRRTQA